MLLLSHAIIPCLHTWIVTHLCGSVNSELRTIYVNNVWSYHNQLFTMHQSGYYNLVSFIFGTTIPTSFNILMKCFLHLYIYAATQGIRVVYMQQHGMEACNNNTPSLHLLLTHVIIVACPHNCTCFSTCHPTSFNILMEMLLLSCYVLLHAFIFCLTEYILPSSLCCCIYTALSPCFAALSPCFAAYPSFAAYNTAFIPCFAAYISSSPLLHNLSWSLNTVNVNKVKAISKQAIKKLWTTFSAMSGADASSKFSWRE